MKRVASLLFGTWLLTQTMLAAVAPAVTSGLLARFDFSNVNGQTTTDAVGGIEAQLMGAATIEQMGDYAVLNLGSANSWLDMTAAVGDLIKNRASFSISCYYRVNDNQYISSNGNFLWSIASQQTCTATAGAYCAYRLNAQRVAHATSGYNTEKGIERGFESDRGRWVSVLFVYNGSSTTGRLFIDGVFVANNTSMPKPATLFASADPAYCYIGRPPFAGDIYLKNTLVTEFCVYSRALTVVDARNLAADISLFGGRLSITPEIYWNTTRDMLYTSYIPTTTGYSRQVQNVGEVTNKGVELTLNYQLFQKKDFDLATKYQRRTNVLNATMCAINNIAAYKVILKEDRVPKAFLDELRCRNGNLNIVCGKPVTKEAL